MNTDIIRQRSGALAPDNPYGFRSVFNFSEPYGAKKLIGPGRPLILNGSWRSRPRGPFGLAATPVASIVAATALDMGLKASQVGWGSSSRPWSMLYCFFAIGTTTNGSLLTAGQTTDAGNFLFSMNGASNFLSIRFWGSPDWDSIVYKPVTVPSITTFVYTYDGAGAHNATICDRDVQGNIRAWYTPSASGSSTISDVNAVRIGIRLDGVSPMTGTGDGIFLVGLSDQKWTAVQRRALALNPFSILSANTTAAKRWDSQAAAASSFKPYWSSQRPRVYGAGVR